MTNSTITAPLTANDRIVPSTLSHAGRMAAKYAKLAELKAELTTAKSTAKLD